MPGSKKRKKTKERKITFTPPCKEPINFHPSANERKKEKAATPAADSSRGPEKKKNEMKETSSIKRINHFPFYDAPIFCFFSSLQFECTCDHSREDVHRPFLLEGRSHLFFFALLSDLAGVSPELNAHFSFDHPFSGLGTPEKNFFERKNKQERKKESGRQYNTEG